MVKTPSARERKLVEDGAKGVAGRWLSDPEQAAQDGRKMRSAVKRFAGKPLDQPAGVANPQAKAHRRSTRAEQAAAGMMGPPPTTFDETAIKDWLDKMSAEDLAKLARLTAIAKAGKREGRSAWNKVDRGIAQHGLHVEVHGGTVNIDNSGRSGGYSGQGKQGRRYDTLGRQFSRLKDFING